MNTLKHMNLQLFAEETNTSTETETKTTETDTTTADSVGETKEKTFTQAELDTLIKDRLARATKNQPTKDELKAFKEYQETQKTDAEKAIEAQKQIDGKITAANERLIKAEIKGLDGYDTKLLSRLVDKSLITVDDNGDVTGLEEQLEALEAEFPMIKKQVQQQTGTGANPPAGKPNTLETEYDEAMKAGHLAEAIAIKNKIFSKS